MRGAVVAVERVPRVLSEVVDGTAVLIDAGGTKVVELNGVGSVVWAAVDGRRQLPDLVAAVLTALDDPSQVTPARCEADVTAFLAELTELGLVREV